MERGKEREDGERWGGEMEREGGDGERWIKKMWHIYTMEYYSAIK